MAGGAGEQARSGGCAGKAPPPLGGGSEQPGSANPALRCLLHQPLLSPASSSALLRVPSGPVRTGSGAPCWPHGSGAGRTEYSTSVPHGKLFFFVICFQTWYQLCGVMSSQRRGWPLPCCQGQHRARLPTGRLSSFSTAGPQPLLEPALSPSGPPATAPETGGRWAPLPARSLRAHLLGAGIRPVAAPPGRLCAPACAGGAVVGGTSRTGLEGQGLRNIRENKHFSRLGSSVFALKNGLGHRGQSHRPFTAHQGDLGAMQQPSVDRTAGFVSPWAPGGTTSPLGSQFFRARGGSRDPLHEALGNDPAWGHSRHPGSTIRSPFPAALQSQGSSDLGPHLGVAPAKTGGGQSSKVRRPRPPGRSCHLIPICTKGIYGFLHNLILRLNP